MVCGVPVHNGNDVLLCSEGGIFQSVQVLDLPSIVPFRVLRPCHPCGYFIAMAYPECLHIHSVPVGGVCLQASV